MHDEGKERRSMITGCDAMPLSIDNLFVPPDGAMQFHATKNDAGEPVDIYVWVWPPVKRTVYRGPEQCPHHIVFPVLMTSVTDSAKKQGAVTYQQKFLCHCHGRIVE